MRVSETRFRAWYLALAALCLMLNVWFSTSAARDDSLLVSTATEEGRLAVFDDVWETIQDRYYDPAFHGIDWEAKRLTFRPAAAKAGSTYELYDLMRRMIASLQDAHTRVYSPDEKFDWWKPRVMTVGVTVREVEGVPIVVHVDPNSAAARTGIRVGDALVKVDGVPVAMLIDKRVRYRSLATLLDGPAGSWVNLSWTTREGKLKSAAFERYWSQRRLWFSAQRKGRLALLKIDAFTQSVALDFSKALPGVLEGAEGIILDLRTNGGGDAEAMADIASLFLADGVNLGRFADRSGASFELQTYSKRLWRVAQLGQVKLPLVVLTSENTSSAAEIMVAALQVKRRARVIGTETCGCVLAIRNRHALPDGGLLDVSEFDYRTAGGVRLQGLGITPDQLTPLTRADVYSRRDAAFEAAKNFLNGGGTRPQR